MVHALETSQPFLFLDNVDIQSRSVRQTDQQAAEPILTVSLDLYGYRSPEKL
ncbi:MAG: GspMb/PilO family protein [Hypericibacter sp.]